MIDTWTLPEYSNVALSFGGGVNAAQPAFTKVRGTGSALGIALAIDVKTPIEPTHRAWGQAGSEKIYMSPTGLSSTAGLTAERGNHFSVSNGDSLNFETAIHFTELAG